MRAIILILCLVPAAAFGFTDIAFKDGSKMCGNYTEKGDTFCRHMDGGELCMKKSDIVSVRTVAECGDTDKSGNVPGYLKEHNLSQQDWMAKKNAREGTNSTWEWKGPAKKRKTPHDDDSW